jgi:cysteinyl-tRNA synthetase
MHEWRRVRNLERLRRALELFGLAPADLEAPEEIHELARSRQKARERRDFAESDRLRAEIEAAGWEVRDEAGGYRVVRP